MSQKASSQATAEHYIVSIGPDVCLTPRGSAMVPVAYFSVAKLKDAVRVSDSVFNNELSDFHLNSRAQYYKGHKPGIGKGVVVPGYYGLSHVIETTSTVYSSGWASCRHRDPASINMADEGPTEPFTPIDKSQT
ncbi:DUF4150 domain-containing protein [Labrys sp. LIt4]|uniref:PAAR-like domain-containing protein n=1 Tax=Labrys sp. LIt4 TaxID=2821355 RepID=UPI001ADFCE87|nr:PAAR-like domain-containing protein [Labrys sp. LIt4]MBP0583479.1 DUF4150 domain-containing protein [Labrys sp. LIt4]